MARGISPLVFIVKGLAIAIRAVTLASLTFIATPVGAIITVIVVAVAALTAGIIWLADRVGGFGNLWELTWKSAKAYALTYAQGIVFALTPIISIVDTIIEYINTLITLTNRVSNIPGFKQLTGGGTNIQTIEFRARNVADAVNEIANASRRDVADTYRRSREEARQQDEAGTSILQNIPGFSRNQVAPIEVQQPAPLEVQPPSVQQTPTTPTQAQTEASRGNVSSQPNQPLTQYLTQNNTIDIGIITIEGDPDVPTITAGVQDAISGAFAPGVA